MNKDFEISDWTAPFQAVTIGRFEVAAGRGPSRQSLTRC
jgi:hypothetical protein